jgi:hypothetical protein
LDAIQFHPNGITLYAFGRDSTSDYLVFFKNPNQDDQDAILALTFYKLQFPQQFNSNVIK